MGWLGIGGGGGSAGPQNNLSGTTPPTVNSDSSAGYAPLSIWFDTTAVPHEAYVCVDATVGAAIWLKTTLTIDELGSMAVQNANNVAITGGTISGVSVTPASMAYPVVKITTSGGTDSALATASRTLFYFVGVANHTLNLPSAPPIGTMIEVSDKSTGTITIARQGSDTIDGATSFAVNSGDFFGFEYVDTNVWIVRY